MPYVEMLRRAEQLNICIGVFVRVAGKAWGESESFDNALLYEDSYTLNYYFPMLIFFVLNFIVLLFGCALFGLYLREERRSEILKSHRENQDRLFRETSRLNLEEEDSVPEEILGSTQSSKENEILDVNGMILSLDATGEEFEIALAK